MKKPEIKITICPPGNKDILNSVTAEPSWQVRKTPYVPIYHKD
jgi:hypothetical protein